MPTYIVMSKWTSQGLQNVKQSPARLDAARKAYESAGIKLSHFWMVTGQYDMIAILEDLHVVVGGQEHAAVVAAHRRDVAGTFEHLLDELVAAIRGGFVEEGA